jgi:hypothetical protein
MIQWQLVPVSLFLENHGKHLCNVDEADEWLEANGFVVKQTWIDGSLVFAEIDAEKTNLADFYSFEQLTKTQQKGTQECWRTFYLMKAQPDEVTSEKAWNENIEDSFSNAIEKIRDYMKV